MAQEQSVKEKIQEKLDEWKSMAEEFNLQLNLGEMDLMEEFEKQKKNVREWLNTASANLDKAQEVGKEQYDKIKGMLEDLRVQINLGKADTLDAIRAQQEKINKSIAAFKRTVEDALANAKDVAAVILSKISEKLVWFRALFDMIRVQLHLGEADASDLIDEKKKQISEALNNLNSKLAEAEKIGAEKWEKFTEDMNESWNKLKTAFTV